ncbi:MAG TPA: RNA polymerase subunit sigma-70 [Thermomicrobiales bacterium]|nr:RNA polymerase subunit sigma-70 [Thermomicrobiales bacterium]
MRLATDAIPREPTERQRLAAAQAGDEQAFGELTRPLRREIHIHCYRMLGSLDDADDALQETFLRAWRQIARFEPRAPFRAWLYRIATNVCLTMLARRARRGEVAATERTALRDDAPGPEGEWMHLDPYPDRLLDELAPTPLGPEAAAERHEGIELAFVAAVQLLPPRQRATLLLRDVVGYSAADVAPMLATTVAGVNSALQRARVTLDQERNAGRHARSHAAAGSAAEAALVRRLAAAWHAADIPAIVALLTEDALITMPPLPDRVVGREPIAAFLATGPGGGRLDRFRLVPTRANRQPAVALYMRDADVGPFVAHAVTVLAIEGGAIASLTRFEDAGLFPRFGLPLALDL